MANQAEQWQILIEKDNIEQAEIAQSTAAPLADGEVLVALQSCGLTSNNVTYAVLGRTMGKGSDIPGYWNFFPSENDAVGILPVWGFGRVQASNHPDLEVGEILYGYFGLTSHTVLKPAHVSATTVHDGSDHRLKLAAVYNQYTRLQGLPPIPAEQKYLWPVFRPLLFTGFMIADQFLDEAFYNSEQLIISSASSKTALMTAYTLNQYDTRPQLIGLTSSGNKSYVQASGLYDEVVTYDEIDQLDAEITTSYIDIAGNKAVANQVHNHFVDQLKFSLGVGLSHWDEAGGRRPIVGPKMVTFFAPGRIKLRTAQWGSQGLNERLMAVWNGFVQIAPQLTTITEQQGAAKALATYVDLVKGTVDPRAGLIATF